MIKKKKIAVSASSTLQSPSPAALFLLKKMRELVSMDLRTFRLGFSVILLSWKVTSTGGLCKGSWR